MPLVKVIRKGITPHIRKVPTSTCAAVMPMTLDRVGRESASENEELTKLESLQHAFEVFQPRLKFLGRAGEGEAEFQADLRFRGMKDFDPENLQKRQEIRHSDGPIEVPRNDLADLKNNIDLLYRLKDRWKLPAVRRAWSNPEWRREIIETLDRLRAELERIAEQKGIHSHG